MFLRAGPMSKGKGDDPNPYQNRLIKLSDRNCGLRCLPVSMMPLCGKIIRLAFYYFMAGGSVQK